MNAVKETGKTENKRNQAAGNLHRHDIGKIDVSVAEERYGYQYGI